MPHAEVGVQNDPIHAIIAAAQEILIQSAQPICHGGYARRTPAYFKLPRRGHFFAARSAKKRSFLVGIAEKDRRPCPKGTGFARGRVIAELGGCEKTLSLTRDRGFNPSSSASESVPYLESA